MFLADGLNLFLESRQVAVVHAWKHVVLDLHVQPPAEEIAPPALGPKVLSRDNLMLQEIFVFRVSGILGEVVDLGVDHEIPREQGDGGESPDQSLPHWETRKRPHEKTGNVNDAPCTVSIEASRLH